MVYNNLVTVTYFLWSSEFGLYLQGYLTVFDQTCNEVCEALSFLLDNIFVRFGNNVYRQTIGIPMGTHCAPLVADLFLYCYERDFMLNLSRDIHRQMSSRHSTTPPVILMTFLISTTVCLYGGVLGPL